MPDRDGSANSGDSTSPIASARTLGSTIHLWLFPLDGPADEEQQAINLLSPDEVAQAEKFHFVRDRRRFIAGRSTLRRILAHYLSRTPSDLRFSYGPAGKPALADSERAEWLQFNLSHSQQWALLAVARERTLGVDLECVQHTGDLAALAKRFFAPAEVAALEGFTSARFEQAFFACWTRKEALLKAFGAGLSLPLDGFCVSVDPDAPAHLLSTSFRPTEASRWALSDITLAPSVAAEFRAALAIEGPLPELHLFSLSSISDDEIIHAAAIPG